MEENNLEIDTSEVNNKSIEDDTNEINDINKDNADSVNEKLAGKYNTPDDLKKAINEVRKGLGLKDFGDKPLVGEGGIYSDINSAVDGYKDLNALYSSRKVGKHEAEKTEETKKEKVEEEKLNQQALNEIDLNDPFAVAQQELSNKGLDEAFQQSVSETWAKDGKLTDEQYKILEEKGGYSKSVVNAHMSALASHANSELAKQQSDIDRAIEDARNLVGGQGELDSLLKWAKTKYNQTEIDDFNRRLQDGTGKLILGAVKQINNDYEKSVGSSNSNPLITNTQTSLGIAKISSKEDLKKIQKEANLGNINAKKMFLDLSDNEFAAIQTR